MAVRHHGTTAMHDTTQRDRQLDDLLYAWRELHMRSRDGTGYPGASFGMFWRTTTWDDLSDDADNSAAVVVDVAVDELPAVPRVALHHKHLGAAWPFARDALPAALCDARERLALALRGRGLLD